MSKPKKTYTLAEVLLMMKTKWQHIAADRPDRFGQQVWAYTKEPRISTGACFDSWEWVVDNRSACVRLDTLFDIERVEDWEHSCLSRKQAERMVE